MANIECLIILGKMEREIIAGTTAKFITAVHVTNAY